MKIFFLEWQAKYTLAICLYHGYLQNLLETDGGTLTYIVLSFLNVFVWVLFVPGKWLGSRQIRCNWAAKGACSNDDKQSSDAKSVVELTTGSSGEELYWLVWICI